MTPSDHAARAAQTARAKRADPRIDGASVREWVLQDWSVNTGRPDSQFILAWFRLAQFALRRWGSWARVVVTPYWWFSTLVVGVELPLDGVVGPRLRLYHPHAIVINPHIKIGADCQLRHGVTVGNKVSRDGHEEGRASIGDDVDLGAGCAVIGDVHVGDHARIGALAMVTSSVPDWGVVAGNPSRLIRIDAPSARNDEEPAPPPVA